MTDRTPAEHVATVREALEDIAYKSPANNSQGNLNIAREKAALVLPALDALEAQAERLQSRVYVLENMRPENYIETLEAAEAQRDRKQETITALEAQLVALAARVAELEAAQGGITWRYIDEDGTADPGWFLDLHRDGWDIEVSLHDGGGVSFDARRAALAADKEQA